MLNSKKVKFLEVLLLVLSSIAIVMAIRSLFDNDDSRVVSGEGRDFLNDEDKMKVLRERLKQRDESDQVHGEIVI